MQKPRILLVTPEDDLSIDLFFSEECKNKMLAKSVPHRNGPITVSEGWDFIYVRGPFVQADFDNPEVKGYIEDTLRLRGNAYSLDGISTFSDILLEDKWSQYQIFADLMPQTALVNSFENLSLENHLIKKRISGRSRDIHFDIADLLGHVNPADYIIQERLDIQTEYRAFMIGDELVLPLEVKTSKAENSKTTVIGAEPRAPKELKEICRQVSAKLKFDFMGLDIAKTRAGYYLIEVNRSPQFVNFYQHNSKNLAENLFTHLIEKSK
jgi:hypothetical protein